MDGTVTYLPPLLEEEIAGVPIEHLFIGALAPQQAFASGRAKVPTLSSALTNHWVVHCTQDEKKSIRVYPSPSGPGASPIAITLSQFDDGIPPDLVQTYHLPVQSGFTLATLVQVMIRGASHSTCSILVVMVAGIGCGAFLAS